jgi:TRAP transporter TAXI family solute receptor
MSYGDLGKVEYLPFGESVELIKNRQLDATLQSAGLGVASLRDLANALQITVVPVPAEVVTKIGDPAYQASVIPANTYQGQTADVPTVRIRNILVTHSGVSDDTVYAMTKTMFENLDQLVSAHAAAKGIIKDDAATVPLPLHPGAERYYREAGLLK